MFYTVPDYYKKFQCIAGDCPDTCCAGWQIVIDDRTRKKYSQKKGTFGNRLYNSIDWKESSFKQYEGRCAFLNEENLCDIYQEAGKNMLCKTCRTYPRHIEEFEGNREISLSLSCPEAARIILSCKNRVQFLTVEKLGEEEYENFDFFLYTKLTDTRDLVIKILQDRSRPMKIRMAMVLALGHDLQRRIHSGQLFLVDDLLKRYEKDGAFDRMEKKIKPYHISSTGRNILVQELFEILDELEILKKDWPDYVKNLEAELEKNPSFQANEDWEIWMEQLMIYFIFTYFCGAVYDENAYGKVKLAVVSTLLIGELAKGLSLKKQGDISEKRAEPDIADVIEAAYRYSKEIEHSDINLGRLEQIFRDKDCCGLENMIRIIVS